MTVVPRVLVRGTAFPSTVSVFDTVILGGGSATIVDHHYDRAMVSLTETSPGVISLDSTTKTSNKNRLAYELPMGRARPCPDFASTPCPTTLVGGASSFNEQQLCHPFVRLAVVGMVFDASGSLLITRRPSYMRSFPSAWVFPGGTVDSGESLLDAVRREVWEETGIDSDSNSWKPECVWESVSPTFFSKHELNEDGTVPPTAIKAHHIVIYLSTILSQQQPSLNLCKDEVEAAVWLSEDDCAVIKSHDFAITKGSNVNLILNNTEKINDSVLPPTSFVPIHDLMGIYPRKSACAAEKTKTTVLGGMAQGSLFALEEFIRSL